MSAQEQLKNLNKEFQQMRERVSKESKKLMKEAFKELFEKHPDIAGFAWIQTAPHAMDGDPTPFDVQREEICVLVNSTVHTEEELDEMEEELVQENEYESYDVPEKYKPFQKKASALLKLIDDDVFNNVFGEDVKVYVRRNGTIDIEEYYSY